MIILTLILLRLQIEKVLVWEQFYLGTEVLFVFGGLVVEIFGVVVGLLVLIGQEVVDVCLGLVLDVIENWWLIELV